MAIAFDAKTDPWYSLLQTVTFSHTCSGSDRLLIVTAHAITGADTFVVKYAGVEMTQIGDRVLEDGGRYARTYALVNPASGANNVTIERTAGGFQTNYWALSYNGCDQTSVPTNIVSQRYTAPIGSCSPTVTVAVANSWLCMSVPGARVQSAGTGTTQRLPSSGGNNAYDSNGGLTTGSHSLVFTQSPDNTYVATWIFEIKPASAAPSPTSSLMMMGCGT